MHPFVARKRPSNSPLVEPLSKRHKSSLFDALDQHKAVATTPEETKAYLDTLNDESDHSLSDAASDEFEPVPVPVPTAKTSDVKDKDDQEDQDAMDWEDVTRPQNVVEDQEIQDVRISMHDDGTILPQPSDAVSGTTTVRKGPSKRDRLVRNGTHQIHVQCLMFHNAVRNAWLCDKEVQDILTRGLSEGIKKDIDHWRRDMGMPPKYESPAELSASSRKKRKAAEAKSKRNRDDRDWGHRADRLENGGVNMSRSDPLLRLLKLLCAYWKKSFTVTCPGLRKQGYMSLKTLREEINGWKKDMTNHIRYGERVASIADLRKLAERREGSRDVGAQLFTALLRGLGFETRMVANLQPAGIGFGKAEDALPRPKGLAAKSAADDDPNGNAVAGISATKKSKSATKTKVINLDTEDESELSSVMSFEPDEANTPKRNRKRYDRDLHFPHYWTEILSPVTNKFIPVDPMVLSTVATNSELLATFEPRGRLADQAKQVMCYTIAHSTDGSAKDVTVRYLKKNQLPGRTKGYRMPVERIKIFNKRGKVLRHEDYDWFKTVMSGYERREHLRTTADDLEVSADLVPVVPTAAANERKSADNSEAFYKASAEFVLRKHLRREEALLPKARVVKTVTFTKGSKTSEEDVYRRSDIVTCKTAESWHKEGRQVMVGEQVMKMVPMRAVTATRKAEIQAIEHETGEKAKQGLFSRAQTEWIIPPPIGPDRKIPHNAFGNIDIYTPSMVPEGAVHIPLRGTMRICNDLKISYAEACTGFEFGNKRAVPILTGVVVAAEHEAAVKAAWKIKEAERRRKEEVKKQVLVLGLWRKMLVGLRIVARLRNEYDQVDGMGHESNPFVNRANQRSGPGSGREVIEMRDDNEETAGPGGFLQPGADNAIDEEDEEEEPPCLQLKVEMDMDDDDVDGDAEESLVSADNLTTSVAPTSLQSLGKQISQRSGPQETAAHNGSVEEATAAKTKRAPRRSSKIEQQNPNESNSPLSTTARGRRRVSGRRQSAKSPYFEQAAGVMSTDDDDNDGEEKVIKPRQTTARTRASAKQIVDQERS